MLLWKRAYRARPTSTTSEIAKAAGMSATKLPSADVKGGSARFFALIETALGVVGLEWSQDGLTKMRLPEADADAMARRLESDACLLAAAAAPAFVVAAASSLKTYANGGAVDFDTIPLDLAGCSAFEQSVYRSARSIGYGKTTTYGDIARALGDVGHSRAVGQALGRNPLAIIVPCHRVLAAGGKPGGFSAYGGRVTKARLLQLEKASLPGDGPTLPGLDLPIVMRDGPSRRR